MFLSRKRNYQGNPLIEEVNCGQVVYNHPFFMNSTTNQYCVRNKTPINKQKVATTYGALATKSKLLPVTKKAKPQKNYALQV